MAKTQITKPKLGLYYNLPHGGAGRLFSELEERLTKDFDVVRLPALTPSPSRLLRDFQNFFLGYIFALQQNQLIRAKKIDILLVGHDHFFAAPQLLLNSPIKTVLYCQEPTRALYEPELGVDENLPTLNYLYETIYRRLKKYFETKNAQTASLILSNSQYSKVVVKNAYKLESVVVYPGVDTELFQPPKTPKRQDYVLVVANDEPQKRLSLAVAAVGKIPKSHRPKLIIVSPRFQVSEGLKTLTKGSGVQLQNLVAINDQELVKLFQNARLTLITSLREPFGLSAAESLACGTPVVAVNEGGLPEIVTQEKSGFLVDPTASSLAHAMQKLLESESMTNLFGQRGRADVIKKFSWESCVREVAEEIYRQLPRYHRQKTAYSANRADTQDI